MSMASAVQPSPDLLDEEPTGEGRGGDGESIRVCVRIRPLNNREIEEGSDRIEWQYNDSNIIEDSDIGRKAFSFDRVFGPADSNAAVYDSTAKPIVMKVLQGYNGTVFAYGQTGSGKTHSMLGNAEDAGILPRAVADVFAFMAAESLKAEASGRNCEFLVRVSYCEVYNEEINDLLQPVAKGKGRNLKILRDDPVKGAIVEGLVEEIVVSPEQVSEVVSRGEGNRHYGTTNMNAGSSRSHTLFRLVMESRMGSEAERGEERAGEERRGEERGGGEWQSIGAKQKDDASVVKVSYLNLVDLAGSERQESAGTTGERLREGSYINKSLSALALVISKLAEASSRTADASGKGAGRERADSSFAPGYGDADDSASIASMVDSDAGTVLSEQMRAPKLARTGSGRNLLSNEATSGPSAAQLARSPSFRMRSGSVASDVSRGSTLKRATTSAKLVLPSKRTLGSPMRSSADSQQDHIPYRNSKLTRLLRQSLGGNSFTAILCAMSPAIINKEESISTLKFATQCKSIVNKAVLNKLVDDKTLLKQYKQRVTELRHQVTESNTQLHAAVTLLMASASDNPDAVAEAASAAGIDISALMSVTSPSAGYPAGSLSPPPIGSPTNLPPTVMHAIQILKRMSSRNTEEEASPSRPRLATNGSEFDVSTDFGLGLPPVTSPGANGREEARHSSRESFSVSRTPQEEAQQNEELATALREIDAERKKAEKLQKTVERLQGLIIGSKPPAEGEGGFPVADTLPQTARSTGARVQGRPRRASISVTNDAGVSALKVPLTPTNSPGLRSPNFSSPRARIFFGKPSGPMSPENSPGSALGSPMPSAAAEATFSVPALLDTGIQKPHFVVNSLVAVSDGTSDNGGFNSLLSAVQRARTRSTAGADPEMEVIAAAMEVMQGNADIRHVLESVARSSKAKTEKFNLEKVELLAQVSSAQSQLDAQTSSNRHSQLLLEHANHEVSTLRRHSMELQASLEATRAELEDERKTSASLQETLHELQLQNNVPGAEIVAKLEEQLAAGRIDHENERHQWLDRYNALQSSLMSDLEHARAAAAQAESRMTARIRTAERELEQAVDTLRQQDASNSKLLDQISELQQQLQFHEGTAATAAEIAEQRADLEHRAAELDDMDQKLAARTAAQDERELAHAAHVDEWNAASKLQRLLAEGARRRRNKLMEDLHQRQETMEASHAQLAQREAALTNHAASLNHRATECDRREAELQQRERQFMISMDKLQAMMQDLAEHEQAVLEREKDLSAVPDAQMELAARQSQWDAERAGLLHEIHELQVALCEAHADQTTTHPEDGQVSCICSPDLAVSATISPSSSPGRLDLRDTPVQMFKLEALTSPAQPQKVTTEFVKANQLNHVSISPLTHSVDTAEQEKSSLQLLAMGLAQVARLQKGLQEQLDRRLQTEEHKLDVSPVIADMQQALQRFGSGEASASQTLEEIQPILRLGSMLQARRQALPASPLAIKQRNESPSPHLAAVKTPSKWAEHATGGPVVVAKSTADAGIQTETVLEPLPTGPAETTPRVQAVSDDTSMVDVAMVAALSAKLRTTQIDQKMTEDALRTEIQTAGLLRAEADSLRSALTHITVQAQTFARVLDKMREAGMLDADRVPGLDAVLSSSRWNSMKPEMQTARADMPGAKADGPTVDASNLVHQSGPSHLETGEEALGPKSIPAFRTPMPMPESEGTPSYAKRFAEARKASPLARGRLLSPTAKGPPLSPAVKGSPMAPRGGFNTEVDKEAELLSKLLSTPPPLFPASKQR